MTITSVAIAATLSIIANFIFLAAIRNLSQQVSYHKSESSYWQNQRDDYKRKYYQLKKRLEEKVSDN